MDIPSFADYARDKLGAPADPPADAEIIAEVSRPDAAARIIKEWKCRGHGYFESTTPVCPHGCTAVERAFLTPPSIRTTNATQQIDLLQDQVARGYGLSNMRTPDIGQTMANKMRPPEQAFQRPTSLAETIQLAQRGINTGTVTIPLDPKSAPMVPELAQARAMFSDQPEIDATHVARNTIQTAKTYKGDAKAEAEAMQKLVNS